MPGVSSERKSESDHPIMMKIFNNLLRIIIKIMLITKIIKVITHLDKMKTDDVNKNNKNDIVTDNYNDNTSNDVYIKSIRIIN